MAGCRTFQILTFSQQSGTKVNVLCLSRPLKFFGVSMHAPTYLDMSSKSEIPRGATHERSFLKLNVFEPKTAGEPEFGWRPHTSYKRAVTSVDGKVSEYKLCSALFMLGEEYVVLIGLTGSFHARLVCSSHIRKISYFFISFIHVLRNLYKSSKAIPVEALGVLGG